MLPQEAPAYEPAGPGKRFLGRLIDSVVIWGAVFGAALGLGFIGAVTQGKGASGLATLLFPVAFIIPSLYFISMHATVGATVGKLAVGTRVVGADQSLNGIGWGKALERWWGEQWRLFVWSLIPFVGGLIALYVVYWGAFNGATVYDEASQTYVVDIRH